MQKILIRCDASSTIGLGHLMRCLVLAKSFKKAQITFALHKVEKKLAQKVVDAGYKIKKLHSTHERELIQLIQKLDISLLVIDNYDISYKTEKKITKITNVKMFVLDDTYKKHHCDILLNHNLGADKRRYKKLTPKNCELRCGSKYTLLREEFLKEKSKKDNKKSKKVKVFLSMGGVDSANLNIKILKSLKKFQNIKVNLVTSSLNPHLNKLQKYSKNHKWIKLHIDSNSIAKLMRTSNFAIITPSVSANEAHFMQLPFITIKTAKNQQEVHDYLSLNNYLTLKKYKKRVLSKNIEFMLELLQTTLTNFTQTSKREKKKILLWRNHKEIRRWMYNKKKIKLKEHLDFISSLETQKNKKYFLVKTKEHSCAVVDLTQIKSKSSAQLGIYTKPNSKGYGKLAMHTLIRYAFDSLELKKLYAGVYIKNIRAISFYKKFHFKTKSKKNRLQIMELKNENR